VDSMLARAFRDIEGNSRSRKVIKTTNSPLVCKSSGDVRCSRSRPDGLVNLGTLYECASRACERYGGLQDSVVNNYEALSGSLNVDLKGTLYALSAITLRCCHLMGTPSKVIVRMTLLG